MIRFSLNLSRHQDTPIYPTLKRALFVRANLIQIKMIYNTKTRIVNYDFSKLREDMAYIFSPDRPESMPFQFLSVNRGQEEWENGIRISIVSDFQEAGYTDYAVKTQIFYPDNESVFPVYMFVDSDESRTVDTPDETIYIPDPEFPHEFEARVGARLRQAGKRVAHGFSYAHATAHLSLGTCNDIGSHENAKKVERTAAAGKGAIGYCFQELFKCVQGSGLTQSEVESMLEKIEASIPDADMFEDFYHDHPATEWQDTIKSKVIHYIGENHGVGEALHDTKVKYTEHPQPDAAAAEDYNHLLEDCFTRALETPHKTLVTEVTQDLPHRKKIRTLKTSYETNSRLKPLFDDFGFLEKSASVALDRVAGVQINVLRTLGVTVEGEELDFGEEDDTMNLWCPLNVTTEAYTEPASQHTGIKMLTVKTNDHDVQAVYGDTTVTLAKNTTTTFTAGQIWQGLTLQEVPTT